VLVDLSILNPIAKSLLIQRILELTLVLDSPQGPLAAYWGPAAQLCPALFAHTLGPSQGGRGPSRVEGVPPSEEEVRTGPRSLAQWSLGPLDPGGE
jgi:hypothetical protein